MKYFILSVFFFAFQQVVIGQNKSTFPRPLGFVNDYEKDFSPAQLKDLNFAIKELLVKAMNVDSLKNLQIAVVTVTNEMFGDEKEISAYATKLGDKWGLAKKEDEKAIIIAYGKSLRKVAIVTSSGLDGLLPPDVCRRIIDERMANEFRKADYINALLAAVKAISERLGP